MSGRGVARLRFKRRGAIVREQISRERAMRLRVERQRHALLGVVGKTDRREVLEIGNGTRPAINGNARRASPWPVLRRRVASVRVTHDLDGEVGLHAPARSVARWPGPLDANEAVVEQQGMGGPLPLRQRRTIGPVVCREQRIVRTCYGPARTCACGRQAHAIGRLVTSNTGAPIRTQRLEEWVP